MIKRHGIVSNIIQQLSALIFLLHTLIHTIKHNTQKIHAYTNTLKTLHVDDKRCLLVSLNLPTSGDGIPISVAFKRVV